MDLFRFILGHLHVSEMDEMLKKPQAGMGSVLGKEKIWSLVFADD